MGLTPTPVGISDMITLVSDFVAQYPAAVFGAIVFGLGIFVVRGLIRSGRL